MKAIEGVKAEPGKTYTVGDEVASLFGFRAQTVDVAQSLRYKAIGYNANKSSVTQLFTGTFTRSGTVTDDEIVEKYAKMDRARKRDFDDLHRASKAALRMGVPREKVESEMRASLKSEAAPLQVIEGDYLPYTLTDDQIKKVRELPDADRRLQVYFDQWEKAGGFDRVYDAMLKTDDPILRKSYREKLKEAGKHQKALGL
jgi:hypothetical protein